MEIQWKKEVDDNGNDKWVGKIENDTEWMCLIQQGFEKNMPVWHSYYRWKLYGTVSNKSLEKAKKIAQKDFEVYLVKKKKEEMTPKLIMTPEKFIEEMKKVENKREAKELLYKLVNDLGYKDGLEVFRRWCW